jgi:hypothetical protein
MHSEDIAMQVTNEYVSIKVEEETNKQTKSLTNTKGNTRQI